ncbi:MAG: Rad52/Rad22 family DNA repair protein [bacterium]|nr:Rad52/Rad22 family DNA repair protein [bacterium]
MDDVVKIMDMERAFKEEELTRPFDRRDIKSRDGAYGKKLDYVEGHKVIERLNRATGNRWSSEVISVQKHQAEKHTDKRTGESVAYPSYWSALVRLTILSMGSRMQVGTKAITGNEENDIKGAITDGLKKAATLFGVGLELYESDDEETDVRPAAEPGRQVEQDRMTEGQRKLLFTICEEMGIPEESRHEHVEAKLGVDLEHATRGMATIAIQELKAEKRLLRVS